MAGRPDYRPDGATITLTEGETAFTTSGAALKTVDVTGGDTIWVDGLFLIIGEVTGENAGTLADPCPAAAAGTHPLVVRYQADGSRLSAVVQHLIKELASGNVEALAGLLGASQMLPMFTGPGAMTLISKAELTSGLNFDVQVDTLADRAQYDAEKAGFTVLVSDVGDGRAAIFEKITDDAGDWSAPAYVTGPVGPFPNVTVGDTDTLAPGSEASVTPTPTPDGVQLSFGIPAGEGFYFRGAYDPGTAYVKDDVVLENGSSWIALQATTGNAPPALPQTSNEWWALISARGQDGEMSGPSSSEADEIALFADGTGRLLKNGPKIGTLVSVEEQTLTAAQQTQARTNIGAATFTATVLGSGVDLNTITAPGPYKQLSDAGAASGANYPVPYAGTLEVLDGGTGPMQRYTTYNNVGRKVYVRTFYNNWSIWEEILYADSPLNASNLAEGTIPDARVSTSLPPNKAYRRGNILGTVSQSGGVPSGAIIERGSNANGEYTRWADGTQICRRVHICSDSGDEWTSSVWTYPASFVDAPIVSATARSIDGGWDRDPGGDSTSSSFTFYRSNSASSNYARYYVIAVGRWF